jgi:hypothetical protein
LEAVRFDNPTRNVARRDRQATGLMPVAWFNDAGGVTLGVRSRSNYLGRFERGLVLVTRGVDPDATHPGGVYARWENPVARPMPRTRTAVASWAVEGRAGLALSLDRALRRRWVDRADPHTGLDALWMATTDVSYLDPGLWDDAGTIEAGPWFASTWPSGRTTLHARLGSRAGVVYRLPGPGIQSTNRYDVEGFWRTTAELSARRPLGGGTTLGVRLFGGGYLAQNNPPRQRRIGIAGADPYETFTNPLLRSRGALFVRPDFHYHAAGDANLRAFAPAVGGRWAVSLNVELTQGVYSRRQGFLRSAGVTAFADGGVVDTLAVPSLEGRAWTALYDAGLGLVTTHAVGDLAWTMRVELPLLVNRWDFAADPAAGDRQAAFRWQVALAPSF